MKQKKIEQNKKKINKKEETAELTQLSEEDEQDVSSLVSDVKN